MPPRQSVLDALATVRDPELDESITELGFVADVDVVEGDVRVLLRLPTFFCAPNFAYLMVADAKAAVARVPGTVNVLVELADHFAGSEISDAVTCGHSFAETFEGQATGGLDDLRTLFERKALVARQASLCQSLFANGYSPVDLPTLTIADLPEGEETQRYIEQLERLGLDASAGAWAIVRASGERIPSDEVEPYLRLARLTKVSIEGNAALCRGLLRTRYGIEGREEALV